MKRIICAILVVCFTLTSCELTLAAEEVRALLAPQAAHSRIPETTPKLSLPVTPLIKQALEYGQDPKEIKDRLERWYLEKLREHHRPSTTEQDVISAILDELVTGEDLDYETFLKQVRTGVSEKRRDERRRLPRETYQSIVKGYFDYLLEEIKKTELTELAEVIGADSRSRLHFVAGLGFAKSLNLTLWGTVTAVFIGILVPAMAVTRLVHLFVSPLKLFFRPEKERPSSVSWRWSTILHDSGEDQLEDQFARLEKSLGIWDKPYNFDVTQPEKGQSEEVEALTGEGTCKTIRICFGRLLGSGQSRRVYECWVDGNEEEKFAIALYGRHHIGTSKKWSGAIIEGQTVLFRQSMPALRHVRAAVLQQHYANKIINTLYQAECGEELTPKIIATGFRDNGEAFQIFPYVEGVGLRPDRLKGANGIIAFVRESIRIKRLFRRYGLHGPMRQADWLNLAGLGNLIVNLAKGRIKLLDMVAGMPVFVAITAPGLFIILGVAALFIPGEWVHMVGWVSIVFGSIYMLPFLVSSEWRYGYESLFRGDFPAGGEVWDFEKLEEEIRRNEDFLREQLGDDKVKELWRDIQLQKVIARKVDQSEPKLYATGKWGKRWWSLLFNKEMKLGQRRQKVTYLESRGVISHFRAREYQQELEHTGTYPDRILYEAIWWWNPRIQKAFLSWEEFKALLADIGKWIWNIPGRTKEYFKNLWPGIRKTFWRSWFILTGSDYRKALSQQILSTWIDDDEFQGRISEDEARLLRKELENPQVAELLSLYVVYTSVSLAKSHIAETAGSPLVAIPMAIKGNYWFLIAMCFGGFFRFTFTFLLYRFRYPRALLISLIPKLGLGLGIPMELYNQHPELSKYMIKRLVGDANDKIPGIGGKGNLTDVMAVGGAANTTIFFVKLIDWIVEIPSNVIWWIKPNMGRDLAELWRVLTWTKEDVERKRRRLPQNKSARAAIKELQAELRLLEEKADIRQQLLVDRRMKLQTIHQRCPLAPRAFREREAGMTTHDKLISMLREGDIDGILREFNPEYVDILVDLVDQIKKSTINQALTEAIQARAEQMTTLSRTKAEKLEAVPDYIRREMEGRKKFGGSYASISATETAINVIDAQLEELNREIAVLKQQVKTISRNELFVLLRIMLIWIGCQDDIAARELDRIKSLLCSRYQIADEDDYELVIKEFREIIDIRNSATWPYLSFLLYLFRNRAIATSHGSVLEGFVNQDCLGPLSDLVNAGNDVEITEAIAEFPEKPDPVTQNCLYQIAGGEEWKDLIKVRLGALRLLVERWPHNSKTSQTMDGIIFDENDHISVRLSALNYLQKIRPRLIKIVAQELIDRESVHVQMRIAAHRIILEPEPEQKLSTIRRTICNISLSYILVISILVLARMIAGGDLSWGSEAILNALSAGIVGFYISIVSRNLGKAPYYQAKKLTSLSWPRLWTLGAFGLEIISGLVFTGYFMLMDRYFPAHIGYVAPTMRVLGGMFLGLGFLAPIYTAGPHAYFGRMVVRKGHERGVYTDEKLTEYLKDYSGQQRFKNYLKFLSAVFAYFFVNSYIMHSVFGSEVFQQYINGVDYRIIYGWGTGILAGIAASWMTVTPKESFGIKRFLRFGFWFSGAAIIYGILSIGFDIPYHLGPGMLTIAIPAFLINYWLSYKNKGNGLIAEPEAPMPDYSALAPRAAKGKLATEGAVRVLGSEEVQQLIDEGRIPPPTEAGTPRRKRKIAVVVDEDDPAEEDPDEQFQKDDIGRFEADLDYISVRLETDECDGLLKSAAGTLAWLRREYAENREKNIELTRLEQRLREFQQLRKNIEKAKKRKKKASVEQLQVAPNERVITQLKIIYTILYKLEVTTPKSQANWPERKPLIDAADELIEQVEPDVADDEELRATLAIFKERLDKQRPVKRKSKAQPSAPAKPALGPNAITALKIMDDKTKSIEEWVKSTRNVEDIAEQVLIELGKFIEAIGRIDKPNAKQKQAITGMKERVLFAIQKNPEVTWAIKELLADERYALQAKWIRNEHGELEAIGPVSIEPSVEESSDATWPRHHRPSRGWNYDKDVVLAVAVDILINKGKLTSTWLDTTKSGYGGWYQGINTDRAKQIHGFRDISTLRQTAYGLLGGEANIGQHEGSAELITTADIVVLRAIRDFALQKEGKCDLPQLTGYLVAQGITIEEDNVENWFEKRGINPQALGIASEAATDKVIADAVNILVAGGEYDDVALAKEVEALIDEEQIEAIRTIDGNKPLRPYDITTFRVIKKICADRKGDDKLTFAKLTKELKTRNYRTRGGAIFAHNTLNDWFRRTGFDARLLGIETEAGYRKSRISGKRPLPDTRDGLLAEIINNLTGKREKHEELESAIEKYFGSYEEAEAEALELIGGQEQIEHIQSKINAKPISEKDINRIKLIQEMVRQTGWNKLTIKQVAERLMATDRALKSIRASESWFGTKGLSPWLLGLRRELAASEEQHPIRRHLNDALAPRAARGRVDIEGAVRVLTAEEEAALVEAGLIPPRTQVGTPPRETPRRETMHLVRDETINAFRISVSKLEDNVAALVEAGASMDSQLLNVEARRLYDRLGELRAGGIGDDRFSDISKKLIAILRETKDSTTRKDTEGLPRRQKMVVEMKAAAETATIIRQSASKVSTSDDLTNAFMLLEDFINRRDAVRELIGKRTKPTKPDSRALQQLTKWKLEVNAAFTTLARNLLDKHGRESVALLAGVAIGERCVAAHKAITVFLEGEIAKLPPDEAESQPEQPEEATKDEKPKVIWPRHKKPWDWSRSEVLAVAVDIIINKGELTSTWLRAARSGYSGWYQGINTDRAKQIHGFRDISTLRQTAYGLLGGEVNIGQHEGSAELITTADIVVLRAIRDFIIQIEGEPDLPQLAEYLVTQGTITKEDNIEEWLEKRGINPQALGIASEAATDKVIADAVNILVAGRECDDVALAKEVEALIGEEQIAAIRKIDGNKLLRPYDIATFRLIKKICADRKGDDKLTIAEVTKELKTRNYQTIGGTIFTHSFLNAWFKITGFDAQLLGIKTGAGYRERIVSGKWPLPDTRDGLLAEIINNLTGKIERHEELESGIAKHFGSYEEAEAEALGLIGGQEQIANIKRKGKSISEIDIGRLRLIESMVRSAGLGNLTLNQVAEKLSAADPILSTVSSVKSWLSSKGLHIRLLTGFRGKTENPPVTAPENPRRQHLNDALAPRAFGQGVVIFDGTTEEGEQEALQMMREYLDRARDRVAIKVKVDKNNRIKLGSVSRSQRSARYKLPAGYKGQCVVVSSLPLDESDPKKRGFNVFNLEGTLIHRLILQGISLMIDRSVVAEQVAGEAEVVEILNVGDPDDLARAEREIKAYLAGERDDFTLVRVPVVNATRAIVGRKSPRLAINIPSRKRRIYIPGEYEYKGDYVIIFPMPFHQPVRGLIIQEYSPKIDMAKWKILRYLTEVSGTLKDLEMLRGGMDHIRVIENAGRPAQGLQGQIGVLDAGITPGNEAVNVYDNYLFDAGPKPDSIINLKLVDDKAEPGRVSIIKFKEGYFIVTEWQDEGAIDRLASVQVRVLHDLEEIIRRGVEIRGLDKDGNEIAELMFLKVYAVSDSDRTFLTEAKWQKYKDIIEKIERYLQTNNFASVRAELQKAQAIWRNSPEITRLRQTISRKAKDRGSSSSITRVPVDPAVAAARRRELMQGDPVTEQTTSEPAPPAEPFLAATHEERWQEAAELIKQAEQKIKTLNSEEETYPEQIRGVIELYAQAVIMIEAAKDQSPKAEYRMVYLYLLLLAQDKLHKLRVTMDRSYAREAIDTLSRIFKAGLEELNGIEHLINEESQGQAYRMRLYIKQKIERYRLMLDPDYQEEFDEPEEVTEEDLDALGVAPDNVISSKQPGWPQFFEAIRSLRTANIKGSKSKLKQAEKLIDAAIELREQAGAGIEEDEEEGERHEYDVFKAIIKTQIKLGPSNTGLGNNPVDFSL